MSRPEIQGLKYFPFDVGFFRDKKIRLLRGEHRAEGVEVYQRILCNCYEDNGYFLPWDNEVDCALMADETGYSKDKIRLIVSSCLKWSLFDNTLFKSGNVLTSRSIQRRYFLAIKDTKVKAAAQGRYTFMREDLCLLTDNDLAEFNNTRVWLKVGQDYGKSGNNDNKSGIYSDKFPNNPTKESKGNKTILNNTDAVTVSAKLQCNSHISQQQQQQQSNNEMTIIQYFINNFDTTPSPLIIEKLTGWLDIFPADVIVKALDEAVYANKRSYKYIEGILKAWEKERLFSIGLVESHLTEWNNKKNKGSVNHTSQVKQNRFVNFKQRDWDYAEIERLERENMQHATESGGNYGS